MNKNWKPSSWREKKAKHLPNYSNEKELFKSILEKYVKNSDPLLRSHAVWAAINSGHKELVNLVKGDPDPLVLNEIILAEKEGCL